jgi:hypothetical protein
MTLINIDHAREERQRRIQQPQLDKFVAIGWALCVAVIAVFWTGVIMWVIS